MWFTAISLSLRETIAGTQGWNLEEAKAEAKTIEEYRLLGLLSKTVSVCLSVLLYSPGPPYQRWYHPEWAESFHINH